jgi:hypothetical protein
MERFWVGRDGWVGYNIKGDAPVWLSVAAATRNAREGRRERERRKRKKEGTGWVLAVDGRRRGETIDGGRIHQEIDKDKGEWDSILRRGCETGGSGVDRSLWLEKRLPMKGMKEGEGVPEKEGRRKERNGCWQSTGDDVARQYGVGVFTKRLIRTKGNKVTFWKENAEGDKRINCYDWDALTNEKSEGGRRSAGKGRKKKGTEWVLTVDGRWRGEAMWGGRIHKGIDKNKGENVTFWKENAKGG